MTQLNITIDSDQIQTLIGQCAANELAKDILTLVFNQIMEQQRTDYINADEYERCDSRKTSRNGYYDRDFTTRVGRLELRVPRTRDGEFSPTIFEQYQRSEKALLITMMEMFIQGVSTRKVSKAVEALCGETVSKSFVSNLTKQLDPIVEQWRYRSLKNTNYPFLITDVLYLKVRDAERVVSMSCHIAIGVSDTGSREIIGLYLSKSETRNTWTEFFDYLKQRDLSCPKYVISDAHKGLVQAIRQCFLGATWQRCQAHFLRNIFDNMPKKIERHVKDEIKAIFQMTNANSARELKNIFINKYESNPKLHKVCQTLDDGFEDAIQVLHLPENIQRRLKTTNCLERLNEEIRRRERVIRIFPNQDSAIRIIGSLLMDKNEEWLSANKKYLDFDPTVI